MKLTKEEATSFFSELFNGEHHIPSKLVQWGDGWYVYDRGSRWATFDWSYLTKLVIMAHDHCYRAEIDCHGVGRLKIITHKRLPMDGQSPSWSVHPTLEQAIERLRKPQPANGNICVQYDPNLTTTSQADV